MSTPFRKSLSFSAASTYLSCPLRYKLLYEDRLAVPTWHFAQYGTSLHRTLEAIHGRAMVGEVVDEEMAVELFEAHWISFGLRAREIEEQYKRAGRDHVVRYVRDYSATFPRIRQVELSFSFELGSCLFNGQIDLIRAHQDGTLEIVDFKTRATRGLDFIRVDLQLGLYALACECYLSAPIGHLTVHLLADGREECFDWNEDARHEVSRTLGEVVEHLAAGDFRPTPGRACRACEFRALCPYSETQ